MNGTGAAVLAVDFGVPAAQAVFAHRDVVLQTDMACFGIRMMVTGLHFQPPFRKTTVIARPVDRVFKNKHQVVSQGKYKLEARGLRLEA
jgi:hypothetical protein